MGLSHVQLKIIDFAVAIGTQDPHALAAFMSGRYDGGGPDDVLDARQIVKVRQPSEEDLRNISSLADRLGIGEECRALSAEHSQDQ